MATGLKAGTYTVTVKDALNATTTAKVTITEPPVLAANISSTLVTKCSGTCNGSATINNIMNGTPPYSYEWDAAANNQKSATALSLCSGNYSVLVKDSNGCSVSKNIKVEVATVANPNIFLTNLAAVDQKNVSPSFAAYYTYNLPANITPPSTNQRNFIDPGKKARFKVECTNKKVNGQSIVSGICKVRTNSPYITISDSSSALNNIGWNNYAWSADEFEIDINSNTPAGTNAYIDFVVQESGQDYATTCIAIPITPLVYSPTTAVTIDDDNNPDSKGNDNDLCEPNETIEFYPWLDNISTLNAEYVRGRFENLDNISGVSIWNGKAGIGTTVYDATWWNYSFAKPQTINASSTNTTPEYDFVFDYNNSSLTDFNLYMVMAGGFKLFSGNALSLVQWSLPFNFRSTASTTIGSIDNTRNAISIYPNPSNGLITLENTNEATYTIINSMGQQVLKGTLKSSVSTIDINSLKGGVYIIQIGETKNQFYKFTKI